MATTKLANERVVADAPGPPERWIYILHGIYGAGRNWGSVARRLVRARPDWGAVLIDLREHGDSRGFDPPHTVGAAAADLGRLSRADGPAPDAVLGHSFGGKVALRFARDESDVRDVWVIDSTPEAREPAGSAWTMLTLLRSLPARFPTRNAAIDAIADSGFARPVAQWMATNLESTDGHYRWRFDLDTIEALLLDFFATDLWEVVERPRPGLTVHVVKAADSAVLEGGALERVRAAADGQRVHLHTVAGGHWVNADNPDALHELLTRHLPTG